MNGKTPLYCFVEYYRNAECYARHGITEELKEAVKMIDFLSEQGNFLFQPLQIKEDENCSWEWLCIYDILNPILQNLIKIHYQPLVDQAIDKNNRLRTYCAEKLTDEKSRYIAGAAFVEATQALPRLIEQELKSIAILTQYFVPFSTEIKLNISKYLLIKWKIDTQIAPILAQSLLDKLSAQQNENDQIIEPMNNLLCK